MMGPAFWRIARPNARAGTRSGTKNPIQVIHRPSPEIATAAEGGHGRWGRPGQGRKTFGSSSRARRSTGDGAWRGCCVEPGGEPRGPTVLACGTSPVDVSKPALRKHPGSGRRSPPEGGCKGIGLRKASKQPPWRSRTPFPRAGRRLDLPLLERAHDQLGNGACRSFELPRICGSRPASGEQFDGRARNSKCPTVAGSYVDGTRFRPTKPFPAGR